MPMVKQRGHAFTPNTAIEGGTLPKFAPSAGSAPSRGFWRQRGMGVGFCTALHVLSHLPPSSGPVEPFGVGFDRPPKWIPQPSLAPRLALLHGGRASDSPPAVSFLPSRRGRRLRFCEKCRLSPCPRSSHHGFDLPLALDLRLSVLVEKPWCAGRGRHMGRESPWHLARDFTRLKRTLCFA